jgi:hypothetical protein
MDFSIGASRAVSMRLSALGNLLIGGTTDITGSGGLKVAGTTDATSSITGAFRVGNDTAATTVSIGNGKLYTGGNAFVGGNLSKAGANGQLASVKQLTEETTITANATVATTIQIPANSIVLGVAVRVTTVVPDAATFTVTGTSSTTAFQTGASVSTAATTTDAGTKSCPYLNTAAQTITYTFNTSPLTTTGRIRIVINYIEITPPTS